MIGGNEVAIHWFNQALKWIYLVFLALQASPSFMPSSLITLIPDIQFVLALGNRPKGERMAYTITLWYVPRLIVYVAGVYSSIQGLCYSFGLFACLLVLVDRLVL